MKDRGVQGIRRVSKQELRVGVQVAYVPAQAKRRLDHPDVQFGFVTSVYPERNAVYCRFWLKGKEGEALKSSTDSERVVPNLLVQYDRVEPTLVANLMSLLMKGILLTNETVQAVVSSTNAALDKANSVP